MRERRMCQVNVSVSVSHKAQYLRAMKLCKRRICEISVPASRTPTQRTGKLDARVNAQTLSQLNRLSLVRGKSRKLGASKNRLNRIGFLATQFFAAECSAVALESGRRCRAKQEKPRVLVNTIVYQGPLGETVDRVRALSSIFRNFR